MYKIVVNGKAYEITHGEDTWHVNGDAIGWDVASLGNGHYHILYHDKGYRAEVVKIDRETKTVDLKINGRKHSIQLRDKFDLLLEKMGMNNTASSKVNMIKAPMPGLIIELRVKPGDKVKTGDPLLVLEAMKMENIIKAPGEGLVKEVKVKKGDIVEKGQLLIEF